MAKNKVDGIIESVRYTPDGQVDWVRAHLRNGKIYTDWVILERYKLIQEIKAGKEFQTLKRLPYMGGMFELKAAVKVRQTGLTRPPGRCAGDLKSEHCSDFFI